MTVGVIIILKIICICIKVITLKARDSVTKKHSLIIYCSKLCLYNYGMKGVYLLFPSYLSTMAKRCGLRNRTIFLEDIAIC